MVQVGSNGENPVIPFRVGEKMIGFSAFCSCPGQKGRKKAENGIFQP